jgi:hypothetical protein
MSIHDDVKKSFNPTIFGVPLGEVMEVMGAHGEPVGNLWEAKLFPLFESAEMSAKFSLEIPQICKLIQNGEKKVAEVFQHWKNFPRISLAEAVKHKELGFQSANLRTIAEISENFHKMTELLLAEKDVADWLRKKKKNKKKKISASTAHLPYIQKLVRGLSINFSPITFSELIELFLEFSRKFRSTLPDAVTQVNTIYYESY